jgi:hypothetical protein
MDDNNILATWAPILLPHEYICTLFALNTTDFHNILYNLERTKLDNYW